MKNHHQKSKHVFENNFSENKSNKEWFHQIFFSIFHDVIYKLQATLKICKLLFICIHSNNRFNRLEGRVINSEIPSLCPLHYQIMRFSRYLIDREHNSLVAQQTTPPPPPFQKKILKIYIYIYTS